MGSKTTSKTKGKTARNSIKALEVRAAKAAKIIGGTTIAPLPDKVGEIVSTAGVSALLTGGKTKYPPPNP